MGMELSGWRLPYTTPWIPVSVLARGSRHDAHHYWLASPISRCGDQGHGVVCDSHRHSHRLDDPMHGPILLSANRNPHRAFEFQKSLVWDHTKIPGTVSWVQSVSRLLCFIKRDPILGNRYGPGVSSCQQTSDNNLGWPDPHPSP